METAPLVTWIPGTPDNEADAWIAAAWLGKPVQQNAGIPEYVGRAGNVAETLWDEKGALHCLVSAPDGCFWCPASMLTTDFLEPAHCSAVSADGYQCTRPKDHEPSLYHYSRGGCWHGDQAPARREKRPSEPVVKHPAPFEGFMRADNPHLGGGWDT